MDQQVKQWIDYAAQDLGVARHLFENYHPKPLEIVCYHCQQSAEKAIKAVIVSLHWPTGIPKSHDLSFLLNQIHNYIAIPDAISDAADAFNEMMQKINTLMEDIRRQETAKREAEQQVLEAQIQPHFLYNVLTSIRALCRIDARKAESALTDFTLYLRGNLDSLSNTGCIPFLQELQHTKHYVDLEKMRFGRDLTVLFNTPVTQFSLPPLTLEPIVENAVRHGVMQRLQGGTVIISTSETESDFVVTVSDDGIGFDAEQLAAGGKHIGLWNVRERLAAVCGGHMEIESGIDKGTNVTMCIPKYRKESE